MKCLFTLLFLSLFIVSVFARAVQTTSGMLTVNDGLANNSVYNIHKDKNGFIWFGTDIGISKYDGYRFTNYKLSDTPSSISIRRIVEIDSKLFCLLGIDGNIMCFDPDQEKVLSSEFDSPSLSDASFTDFTYIGKNDLCVLHKRKLINLHISRKGDKVLFSSSFKEQSWQEEHWLHICKDAKNRLFSLAEEKKELYCYNFENKVSSVYDISDLYRHYELSNIAGIYVDDDCLWLRKRWHGIICYNLKNKSHRQINVPERNFDVRQIISMGLNNYCLVTWNGLFQISFENTPSQGEYELILFSDETNVKIKNAFISAMYDEKENVLWGATFGGGTIKYLLDNVFFNWIDLPQNMEVNKVVEDNDGYIWLTTVKNALLKSNSNVVSEKLEFKVWNKIGLSGGKYALYKDKKGFLWVGDTEANFYCINPLTDDYTKYRIALKDDADFSARILDFCLDSDDNLWMTTNKGLVLFNRTKNTYHLIEDEAVAGKSMTVIKEDPDGDIWIGTQMGLVRLIKEKNQTFRFVDGYETSIGEEPALVYSIFVNSNNRVMVGYADRLITIDGAHKDKVEKIFQLGNNLPNGQIYCITEDGDGNLWIGNNSGIMTLKVGTNLIYTYSYVGNNMAVCSLKDGRLLWTTLDKLLYYNPALIKNSLEVHPFAVSRLVINNNVIKVGQEYNGQVVLPQSVHTLDELTLNHANRNFTLFLTDLQYKMVGQKMFYRMLPDNEEWAVLDVRDGLTFTGLDIGKHVLQVQAVAYDGNKGEVEELTIHILPHWSVAWWAWMIYCILFVTVVYLIILFIRYRVSLQEQKNLAEERLKNELYRAELKHSQEKESSQIRNKFYGLVTNELRTPLFMIVNPLRQILNMKVLSGSLKRDVEIAYYNSIGLKDICTQLTDMYRMETDYDYLQVSKCDISDVIEDILKKQQENLNAYKMELHHNVPEKGMLDVWADREMLEFIIRILLSNAYRHVKYIGRVEIGVYQETRGGEEFCVLSVHDNGYEKVDEDVEVFLQKVYLMNGAIDFSKLELGFDLVKRIVDQHHGEVLFHSKENEGTLVTIKLRCGIGHFSEDSRVIFVQSAPTTSTKDIKDYLPLPDMDLWNWDEEDNVAETAGDRKKKLLIVEDNQTLRLYLKLIFAVDYKVFEAVNGQEGIDIALRELPDVVLCDVMMPVKNGFDCCRELKGNLRTCHIPFIFLTAKGMEEDIMNGMEMGADDYLQKPVNVDVLKAKVASIIRNREYLKQTYMRQLVKVNQFEDDGKELMPVIEDAFIKRVIELVEEHLQDVDFGVTSLAQLLNMSQPTLYRKVKQSTDFNIAELIRGVRLKKAAELLEKGDYSIQEVVEMVGYNDQASFRKHFMKLFNMTPSAYVKQFKS